MDRYDWQPFPGPVLPPERRKVLVAIAGSDEGTPCGPGGGLLKYDAPAVAVGYLRIHSDGPFFVVPGFGRKFRVTHWCDALGDDFNAPVWKS